MNNPFNDPSYKGKQLLIDYCHLSPLGGEVAASNLVAGSRFRLGKAFLIIFVSASSGFQITIFSINDFRETLHGSD